jgi:hypothetical protein
MTPNLSAPQRKKKTHVTDGVDPGKKAEPRTFVFRRGKNWVSSSVQHMQTQHTGQTVAALGQRCFFKGAACSEVYQQQSQ